MDWVDNLVCWAKGKKAPPHKVLLYPTNRCNLKCPFCFQRLNPYFTISLKEGLLNFEDNTFIQIVFSTVK